MPLVHSRQMEGQQTIFRRQKAKNVIFNIYRPMKAISSDRLLKDPILLLTRQMFCLRHKYGIRDACSNADIFTRFHQFLYMYIHFHLFYPLSSILSTLLHFYLLLSTFINFHPHSSIVINFHPLALVFIHLHPLSSVSIHLNIC